jgi:hypothetical protein
MEHLMDPLVAMMKDLGDPETMPSLNKLSFGNHAGGRKGSVEQLAKEEKEMLLGLLGLRARAANASMSAEGCWQIMAYYCINNCCG